MLAELQFGKSPSYTNNRDWFREYAHHVTFLAHPTLLRVVDVCVDERDQWVLIREALPGRCHWLYDRSVLDNRNELETISSILLSVSQALSYLHQASFRGINFSAWHESARIVESPDGELHFGMAPPTPRDAYLGPAKYKYEGCLAYTAPEALAFHHSPKASVYHPPTVASDSFSLGCLLFELLARKTLLSGTTGKRVISETAINSEIRQLSREFTLPAGLGDFIDRTLTESPEVRPSLKEWALMMERLGGRLLMPARLTEQAPQSEEAIESGTLRLFSVLEGAVKKQKVDLLARIRPDNMGGEYLVQISSLPSVKETDSLFNQASNKEHAGQRKGDAELLLVSHEPPGPPASGPLNRPPEFDDSSAVITDSDKPTSPSERTTQTLTLPRLSETSAYRPIGDVPQTQIHAPITGALPDDFIPNQRLPATVNTGALPADFVAEPDTPLYLDDNVQFTVYRPKAIVPQKWYSLLAFAHLSEKREDAPEDEPDPVAEVRQQARRILGEQAADYQNLTQDTLQAIPREGTITFLPTMPGVEFNPASRSFTWEESVHREDFRLRAKQSGHGGRVLKGRLSVFLGSILLADIPLSIRVDSHETSKTQKKVLEEVHARPYRKIFASYSHRDMDVVEQFERFAEALGDRYLRDVRHLRSGELWDEKLEEMIVEADIFQLFWSSNSMTSPFVRQEWEYALSLQRPNFIRPTYWEEPLPVKPDQKLPPEELMRLHFQRIRGAVDSRRRAESTMQGGIPLASAPADSHETGSAVRAGQSSRAQSRERSSASSASDRRATLMRPAPRPPSSTDRPSRSEPDDLARPLRPRATTRGVGGSESAPSEEPFRNRTRNFFGLDDDLRGGRIGSSGRQGVGGSDRSDSARTIPSYRPPAAAPPPDYSSSYESAGRSGSGERLDVGYEPKSRSLAPIIIGLVLLILIGVALYFLLR